MLHQFMATVPWISRYNKTRRSARGLDITDTGKVPHIPSYTGCATQEMPSIGYAPRRWPIRVATYPYQ